MELSSPPKLSPQCRLVLSLLKGAWPNGVHSHDLRAKHGCGDPSKRICELKDAGYEIRVEQANRGKRNGVLFILHRAEFDAVPQSSVPPKVDGEAAGNRPARAGSLTPAETSSAVSAGTHSDAKASAPPSHTTSITASRPAASSHSAAGLSLDEVSLEAMEEATEYIRGIPGLLAAQGRALEDELTFEHVVIRAASRSIQMVERAA
ncbi:MAG: hypothetical protein H0U55_13950 [Rubrobacteraceae bacterium]|nr:hypothetical protein [Rubrobacteraceae bacterium]